jgi:FkbM family methyltransferase
MRSLRPVPFAISVLLLGGLVLVAGYVGGRAGRHYEYNYLCCGMAKRHNMLTSLKESLGLVRFPSQIGQDRWVAEVVFPGVANGFFLDVGSADGYFNSNTWALERRGWSGICVDPFPTNMGARTCRVFKDAVDSVSGRKVSFAAAGETGGITTHLSSGKDAVGRAPTVTLPTVTLGEILHRAAAPPFIHFLSLDIEGAELEALRGFPFAEYKVGAMAIEHNYEEPKRSQIGALLNAHGYIRARTWMQDDFYLAAGLR